MGGTGYDKKSGNIRDGWRVTGRDFRFSGGIGAKTGRYLARARPRLPAEPVDARGSRCGPGARDHGIVQQPRYVRPARKTKQHAVAVALAGWLTANEGRAASLCSSRNRVGLAEVSLGGNVTC